MSLIDDYKNGKRYGTDWQAPSFQHMNDLVGTVSGADDKADDALSKSTTAESNSSTALTKATTAETNSTNAVNTANTANSNSQTAVTTANGANTKSEQAVSTANEANTKATNAETTANNLTQAPDVSEANKFGVVNVEIIGTGTNKKFKFSNLKGNGITSVDKTSSSGLQDTYTITYNDSSTDTFIITNGDSIELRVNGGYFQWKYTGSTDWINLLSLGELSNVDQELSETSTNAIANKAVKQALDGKLDTTGGTITGILKTNKIVNLGSRDNAIVTRAINGATETGEDDNLYINYSNGKNVVFNGGAGTSSVTIGNGAINADSDVNASALNLQGAFTALQNIGGGFSISDPVNVGIELGRKDGTPGTPYLDFHTDGNPNTDYNVRILAAGNGLNITALSNVAINGEDISKHIVNGADNGYIMKYDGTLICYGRHSASTGDDTVTLPYPFKDTNYKVAWGSESDDGQTVSARMISARNRTTSTFVNRFVSGNPMTYIAIGKWK